MSQWIIEDDSPDPDPDTCPHNEGTITKFDGGRLPVLCSRCYIILRYGG